MFKSINKVTLQGIVEKDPEFRTTPWGTPASSLNLSTSIRYKDKKTNSWKELKEYHRISILNDSIVDFVKNMLTKGSKIYLEGQLKTRNWKTDSGETRYITEIILGKFDALLRLADDDRGENPPSGKSFPSKTSYNDFNDDEIPF